MFSHHREALHRIQDSLRSALPNEFSAMFAFGSRVRGSHGPDSDYDILVIVKTKNPRIESAVIDAFLNEEDYSGITFDPVIKSLKSFNMEKKHRTSFYRNVSKEGTKV
jgi:predicted nucleotidyltransferase